MDILHNITWKQFLTFLTMAFLIYYGAAILLMIKQWLQNAKTSPGKKTTWHPHTEEIQQIISEPVLEAPNEITTEIPPESAAIPPEEETQIIRFGNGLEKLIDESRIQPDPETILIKLTQFFSTFTELNNDLFRMPLTAVVQKRIQEECNIEFTTTEIENIWNDSLDKKTGLVVG